MIPDILVLDKGNLTEYFSRLEDIMNDEIAIPLQQEERVFQVNRLNDLKIEVSKRWARVNLNYSVPFW